MDGRIRSAGVLKKKSSSGCLIIRKRSENKDALVALDGLKRHRSIASVGGSSTEDESFEYMRRNVSDNALRNGSMVCKIETEGSIHGRNNAPLKINGERKRSGFEFDEHDAVGVENKSNLVEHSGFGKLNEFRLGSLCGSLAVEKREQDSFIGSHSVRSKGAEYGGGNFKGFELEEGEESMPISLSRLKYQERADQAIRLQGKNGVLKVLVSKNKKMDLPSQYKNNNPREFEERKGPKSGDIVKKDILAKLPLFSASKPPDSPGMFVEENKMVEKKRWERKLEKVKPVLNNCSKSRDSEINGTDTILKLTPPGQQTCISKDGLKKEEERSLFENVIPVKGKEGKSKGGGNTEKQMLREKIRQMLVDSGWTIDYRRRRNRDYLDAVYINPRGTTYWSIIKAYDAFKKQLVVANGKSKSDPSFSSLPDDLINKLTRQTKNKIELERKRQRKEDDMIKGANKSAVRDAAKCSDHDQDKGIDMPQKGELCDLDKESEDYFNDYSPKKKPTKDTVNKLSVALNSNVVQVKTRETIGRGTLQVRKFNIVENTESKGYVPCNGKRTVLAWLIDSGVAKLSEKLQCMNRKRNRVILEGWITRDGIHCGCCSKILTVSKFELHAGSKLRQPFQNMFLESGASLLQCQIDAWNRHELSLCRDFHVADVDDYDPHDDTCVICGHGGDLIGCDRCPSTVHETCLEIKILSSIDWRCSSCTCKICGNVSGNAAEENDNNVGELIRCSFCEKKYHPSCSERSNALPLTSDCASFCGLKCQELYEYIQKILGVKQELEAGYSWSLIQRTDISDASQCGFPRRVECNSKLAVASSIMDECFLPIFDRSGINTMHNVVNSCGSNFNRLNYNRFYTAILERGDEIISAASIRIHGTLAEMPFIGTSAIYRRKGMCQFLLSAIETELCSLGVGKLVVPALSEQMNMWTTAFGFNQLNEVQKRELKSLNIFVFPGTDMLQKQLL